MMNLLLLAAQAASSGGGSTDISFFAAYKHSPVFITANIFVSCIAVTVIVERIIFQLTKYRVNSKEFFAQIKKLVEAGNIDRAIKLCDASNYPVLQLVKAGLTHANKGPDEIDAALSEKLSDLKPQAEKYIPSLWSLANISTLIGLLGTVFGLIATFSSVGQAGLSPSDKQRLLSLGIAEAMYNTMLGLGIAVFCMICHLILHTRAKNIVHDLETVVERTFNLLTITSKPGFLAKLCLGKRLFQLLALGRGVPS
jgi:biopolymer transport protein ExbB